MPEKAPIVVSMGPAGYALAGALGSCVASAITYPLDTVKTRIQAEGSSEKRSAPRPEASQANAVIAGLVKILKEEGLAGYYKGFFASMVNTFSMSGAYFFFYNAVRSAYLRRLARARGVATVTTLSTAAELLLGAVAGALAQIFTIPVAVIATRQQLDVRAESESQSFMAVAREIIAEDGPSGLWRGLRPGLVLTVNPAITYGAFERIKGVVLRSTKQAKLSPGMAFLVGASSKTLATVVTYPYIMAKVRLQARPDPSPVAVEGATKRKEKYSSAVDLLKQVYADKGLTGWYQGMGAQIFKAVLSQGILFMLKDQFETYTYVLLLALSRTPRPRAPSLSSAKASATEAFASAQAALPSVEGLQASRDKLASALPSLGSAVTSVGRDVVQKVIVDVIVDGIEG